MADSEEPNRPATSRRWSRSRCAQGRVGRGATTPISARSARHSGGISPSLSASGSPESRRAREGRLLDQRRGRALEAGAQAMRAAAIEGGAARLDTAAPPRGHTAAKRFAPTSMTR